MCPGLCSHVHQQALPRRQIHHPPLLSFPAGLVVWVFLVVLCFCGFLFFSFLMIATFFLLMSHRGGRALILSDLRVTRSVGTGRPSLLPYQGDSIRFPNPAAACPLHVLFLSLCKARGGPSARRNAVSWRAQGGCLTAVSWLSSPGWQCNPSLLGPHRKQLREDKLLEQNRRTAGPCRKDKKKIPRMTMTSCQFPLSLRIRGLQVPPWEGHGIRIF